MDRIRAIETRVGDELIRCELHDQPVVIGRAATCDVTLPDPSISRRHARLRREDGVCILDDLGSSNGTRVNDRPVTGPVTLRPEDRVALAGIELTLITDATAPLPERPLTLVDVSQPTGAEIAWQDVERWRVDQRSHRDRLLKMMLDAAALIRPAITPESLYEPVLDLVDQAFQPDAALIIRAENPTVPHVAAARYGPRVADHGDVVLSRSVVRRVLEECVALVVEDSSVSYDSTLDARMDRGATSALAVPLLDEEQVMGLLWVETRRVDHRFKTDDLKACTLLAGVFGHALTQARMNVQQCQLRRLETELDTARSILATILPTRLPDVEGYEVCAHLDSCHEVGGDLYQLRNLPDGRLLLVNGDVAGKGLGAALLVATILPVLGVVCEGHCDPATIVTGLNRHIWQLTDTTRFATLFVGLLDTRDGRLTYVNAGHNPPYLVSPDGGLRTLEPTGLPVGMFETASYETVEATLAPGETLVLYSDGVSEADAGGEFYGEERFAGSLRRTAGGSAPELLAAALCDLAGFLAGREPGDDVTLVLVKRLAAATAHAR